MSARGSARTKGGRSGHGGARRGAGRKAGALPEELAKLVPDFEKAVKNPIRQQRYVSTVLMACMEVRVRPWLYSANMKAIDKLAKEIRATAAAMSKIVPADIQFQAAQLLRDDEDEMKRDKGPEEEKRDASKPSSAVRASEA